MPVFSKIWSEVELDVDGLAGGMGVSGILILAGAFFKFLGGEVVEEWPCLRLLFFDIVVGFGRLGEREEVSTKGKPMGDAPR